MKFKIQKTTFNFFPAWIALAAAISMAPLSAFGVSGYGKIFLIHSRPTLGEADQQLVGSIRFNFDQKSEARFYREIHYELTPVFQLGSRYAGHNSSPLQSALPLIPGPTYRLRDLNETLSSDDKHTLYQNLDRFLIRWRHQKSDFTFGRQAITFGTARAISPTDVFLPYSFSQINAEYRRGVDAIRFQRALNSLGEIDAGVVFGDRFASEESAYFLRARLPIKTTDYVAQLIRFSESWLIGGGTQGVFGAFGLVSDFAHVWRGKTSLFQEESYFRFSVSLDRHFPELTSGLFAFLEYHFNGAGGEKVAEYTKINQTFPYRRGGVFLLGQNYLIIGASLTVTPLLNLRTQVISNLNDQSIFLAPLFEYNTSENLYLEFGALIGLGKSPISEAPISAPLSLQSEFGSYPDQVYFSLRSYY